MADAAAALAPTSPLTPGQSPLAPASDDGASEKVTVTAKAPNPKDALDAHFEDMEGKVGAIDEATGALKPPKLDIPKAPEPKQTDPVEAWGSSAMVLAAVGSLLTRTPLTTAMNSAAAVMKAYKQNDLETAQQEFERWKTSSEMAIKQQDFQMEAYKAALSKASTDRKAATADFMAYAKAFGDKTAYDLAQTRGLEAANKYMLDLAKYSEKMKLDMPKVVESNNFMAAFKDPEFQAKVAKLDPGARGQAISELLQKTAPDLAQSQGILDDDAIKDIAQQSLAGDTSAMQGLGYGKTGAANRARALNEKAALMKQMGWTGADAAASVAAFQGLKAGFRTADTTSARIGLGVAELKRLEPQVQQVSAELQRSNYPSFNAVIQAGQREGGDPKLKEFAVRLQGLKSAFSQVLTRGGVPTDSARATTDELFSTRDPVGVTNAALVAMNSEASAIEQAPGDVRKQLSDTLPGKGGGAAAKPPAKGTVEDGFRFKGGDPADANNWEPVNK